MTFKVATIIGTITISCQGGAQALYGAMNECKYDITTMVYTSYFFEAGLLAHVYSKGTMGKHAQ